MQASRPQPPSNNPPRCVFLPDRTPWRPVGVSAHRHLALPCNVGRKRIWAEISCVEFPGQTVYSLCMSCRVLSLERYRPPTPTLCHLNWREFCWGIPVTLPKLAITAESAPFAFAMQHDNVFCINLLFFRDAMLYRINALPDRGVAARANAGYRSGPTPAHQPSPLAHTHRRRTGVSS